MLQALRPDTELTFCLKNFLKNLPQPIQELSIAVDRFNAKTACLSKGLEVFGQHSQVNKSKRYIRVPEVFMGFIW